MRKLALAVLLLAFVSNVDAAKNNKESDAVTAAPTNCPLLQASTHFVPDKGQKGSATKLTESHKNAEAQGWNFDEMSLYTEDGDLKGFYVTYTRPHPCNDK